MFVYICKIYLSKDQNNHNKQKLFLHFSPLSPVLLWSSSWFNIVLHPVSLSLTLSAPPSSATSSVSALSCCSDTVMKSEYYTLHTNGSFERINQFQKKKKIPFQWNKRNLILFSSFVILFSVGATLIGILSLHISQNILYEISNIVQVFI